MNLIQLQQQKISSDNVYQFLLYFDKRYDYFTDAEKKEFMTSFIERIDIYPEWLPSGRILKHIDFRFPVFYKEQEITGVGWDNENGVEVIVLLSSFDVDSSGGDGSLNPNSTYTGWNWVLVRSDKRTWEHVDHGY